jgi:hypothetical protein
MTLDFPQIVPSGRSVEFGNYPVKTFTAQNGSELRILYGNQRTGKTLTLSYNGITDAVAEQFYDHYDQQKGTFETFSLGLEGEAKAKEGWEGNEDVLGSLGNWRYAGPPVITNVYPGVSNVSVSLVGVLE